MSILYGIGNLTLMLVLIIVFCIIWYCFGPKLANGEPYYCRTAPASISLFIIYAIKGIIRHNFWGEIGGLLGGWALLAAIWLFCVAIQFVRPGRMVYTHYVTFWEQYTQSSAYITATLPFPVMHPKYNQNVSSFACILNPLAWYDYLVWKIVASPMPTAPEVSRVEVCFIKSIGIGTIAAVELVIRDYPDITGTPVGVLHKDETVEVYELNIHGWYGFYSKDERQYIKADYVQVNE